VAVGRSYYGSERDALGIYDRGAFDAQFASVYRVSARLFASTGSLGEAAIDGHIGKTSKAKEP
jgi:hypothetical protein